MHQNLINHKKIITSCLRSSLFVLGLLLFAVSTLFAQADKKITIPYKQATGLQLTELIQKETGYTFSFDETVAGRLKRKIDIPSSIATVNEMLLMLHQSLQIAWKQIGSSIVLSVIADPVKKQPPPPASLKGRIVDFETSQPLPGATVKLLETGATRLSDEKGYYEFKDVPDGHYTLLVSFAGYQNNVVSNIGLAAGKVALFDIKMQAGGTLNEVVVSSGPRRVKAVTHTTDRELIREIRSSNSIITGISSEQISKSADRNAAQVVQRTSGITLKDEKFVISRGMDPRYTAIFLNGNLAPSTELYSRTFALDLIPSRIIDRILVYKSPAPDIYGDMSGGAIKIFTKDAKAVRHFDIELVMSDRIGTSFKPILSYQGGKYDFLGFDDGSRKLPSGVPGFGDLHKSVLTQPQYVQAFSPVLQYGYRTALPDLQLILNYYTTFKLGHRRISSLSSLNYRYEAQRNDIYTQTGNTNDWARGRNNTMGNEDQNIENVQANLLQNFSMRLKDSGQVYFRNFALEDATNAVIVRQTRPNIIPGQNGSPTSSGFTDVMSKNNILSFTQRFLYSGNLGGEHYLDHKRQSVRWNLGHTYSHQDIPDQRIIRLQHTPYTSSYAYPYTMPAGTYKTAEGVGLGWESYYRGQDNMLDPQPTFGMITRLWLRNTEGVYNASADYDFHLRPWITLKAGTLQQWKEREVYRKQFKVNDGQEGLDPWGETHQAGYYSYSDWKKVIFSEQDLRKLWSNDYLRDDATALKVNDNTQTQDSYKATEQLNAGYLAFNAQLLGGRLDIYGGLRTEYDRQKLSAAPEADRGQTTPILVDRPLWSWLPSLNLSYRSRHNWVLRAAYGRTVNRPEFREISPFGNFDFLSNESISGNPKLISAHLDNYDLRAEFYPTGTRQDEMISLGGFYKKLYDPIERIREQVALEQVWTSISYNNAGQGELYGMEMELHKNLGFIGGKFFRNLSFIANGTLIHSEVYIPDTIRLTVYKNNGYKRPLQGQAPYIANAGLFYDNAGSGTKFSISYNITGTPIYAAGRFVPFGGDTSNSVYRGSILELPRHLVDLSITQRIIRSLQMKLSVQNLLNEAITYAEDNNFNYKYDKEKGIPQYKQDGTPALNPDGTQSMKYEGDNIFRKYFPNRYIRLTITYAF